MKKYILLSLAIAISASSFSQQRTMKIHSSAGDQIHMITDVDSITFGQIETSFEETSSYELPYKHDKGMSLAVADDGTVFVGNDGKSSEADRGNANMFAIKDGTLLWSYLSGEVVRSAPTISADGSKVFFSDYNDSIFVFNTVDGSINTTIKIGGNAKYSSTALGSDGTLYAGRDNDKLYSLDPVNATINWTYDANGDVLSSPVIDAAGNIYFSVRDDSIRSLAPDGTERWAASYGGDITKGYIASCHAISETEQTLYFTGKIYPDDNSSIIAVNLSDGAVKWTVAIDKTEQGGTAIDAEGNIYVGTEGEGNLIAFGKMGNEIWRFKAAGGILAAPAIDNDGNLYFGDNTGVFYMLNNNGNLLRTEKLGASIISSAAIGNDGKVYILVNIDGDKSKVCVLETGATGPADSEWPMFGNNAKRTGRNMN